jgi:hypothetical protein
MPGLTTGLIEALTLDPSSLRLTGRVFTMAHAALLGGLKSATGVTVVWDERRGRHSGLARERVA